MSDTYIVNPLVHVVRCGDDEILVKQGTRSYCSEIITDELRSGVLGDVLECFRGGATVAAVIERFPETSEAVKQIIDDLAERNVLVSPYEQLGAIYTSTIHGANLADASSRVIGAGPLGRTVAEGLRDAGVGEVHIFDPRDGIDNLDIETAVADADLTVVAWEQLSPKLFTEVNLACIDAGTPWLPAYVDGHEGIVGPTVVPGESACWFEFLTQTEASITQKDSYYLFKDHLNDMAVADVSRFCPPPLQWSVAGFAIATSLRTLAGQPSPTVNRALRVDLDRFTIDYQAILRLPRCPACASQRAAYRQLFL